MGVSFLKANTDRIAHDYYATPPRAVIEILKYESFSKKYGSHAVEAVILQKRSKALAFKFKQRIYLITAMVKVVLTF